MKTVLTVLSLSVIVPASCQEYPPGPQVQEASGTADDIDKLLENLNIQDPSNLDSGVMLGDVDMQLGDFPAPPDFNLGDQPALYPPLGGSMYEPPTEAKFSSEPFSISMDDKLAMDGMMKGMEEYLPVKQEPLNADDPNIYAGSINELKVYGSNDETPDESNDETAADYGQININQQTYETEAVEDSTAKEDNQEDFGTEINDDLSNQETIDQRSMDQGPIYHGLSDQGPIDYGLKDQGPTGQEPIDQGPIGQEPGYQELPEPFILEPSNSGPFIPEIPEENQGRESTDQESSKEEASINEAPPEFEPSKQEAHELPQQPTDYEPPTSEPELSNEESSSPSANQNPSAYLTTNENSSAFPFTNENSSAYPPTNENTSTQEQTTEELHNEGDAEVDENIETARKTISGFETDSTTYETMAIGSTEADQVPKAPETPKAPEAFSNNSENISDVSSSQLSETGSNLPPHIGQMKNTNSGTNVAEKMRESVLNDKLGMELLSIVHQIQEMQKEITEVLES